MSRDEEIEALRAEIKVAEDAIHPKKQRLTELYQEQGNDIDARLKRDDKFTPDELCYAADARCRQCNAGLAYPKKCGPWGEWRCSEELLNGTRGHETYPFTFYEIKSESQPSANGRTTRPA